MLSIEKFRRRNSKLRVSTCQSLLIAFALMGYPLVAVLSTALTMNGSILAISMRAVVLAISILMIVRNIFYISGRNLKYLIVFVIFWAIYLLRLIIDTNYYSSQLSMAPWEYWTWAVGVCLIPSFGLVGVSLDRTLPKAFNLAWIGLGLAVALSLYFGSTIVTGLDGIQTDTGRLALESLNPISMGHLGASLAILSGWYWWTKPQSPVFLRVGSIGGIIAGLLLLLLSASRGPIFGLAFVIVAILSTFKLNRFVRVISIASLVMAAVLSVVTSFISLDTLSLITRIIGSTSGSDLSVESRQDSFLGAWNQFLDSPLLGDFLEERSTGYYPHNISLEAFMATGLGGGMALLTISIIASWKAYSLMQLRSPHAWIGLIFIQYLVGAQLSGAIIKSPIFWSFAVLIIFAKTSDQASSGAMLKPSKFSKNRLN